MILGICDRYYTGWYLFNNGIFFLTRETLFEWGFCMTDVSYLATAAVIEVGPAYQAGRCSIDPLHVLQASIPVCLPYLSAGLCNVWQWYASLICLSMGSDLLVPLLMKISSHNFGYELIINILRMKIKSIILTWLNARTCQSKFRFPTHWCWTKFLFTQKFFFFV